MSDKKSLKKRIKKLEEINKAKPPKTFFSDQNFTNLILGLFAVLLGILQIFILIKQINISSEQNTISKS